MRKEFKDVINMHKGKEAYAIGHGPSLNPYLNRIEEFSRKGVLIGCNEWYHIYKQNPNFWVIANNAMSIKTDLGIMNSLVGKTTVVYADSVDLTDRGWVESNLKADYLPYDQRHFNSKGCGSVICCKHIIPGRLTIQEELAKYTNQKVHYGGGSTVMLHCVSLAILLGCNPINVIGMDLDYKKGYAQNTGNLIKKITVSELDHYRPMIIEDMKTIVESATAVGVTVQTPNIENQWGIFKYAQL